MALQDTLTHISGKAPATKNRVDLLLDKLRDEKPDDYKTLYAALRDLNVRPATLTMSLRVEYKDHDVVTDTSVSHWRSKNLREVNGL
jgi:hypothetical protein